jgi:hypothetical protein
VIRRHRLSMVVTSACVAIGVGRKPLLAIPFDQHQQVAELRRLGGWPWYPTIRLFRQERAGDGSGVFGRTADELRRIA